MYNTCRIVLWLAAWLVLGLPLPGLAQNTTTFTNTTATAIGPSNAVQVTTLMFVGPQTIPTGTLGLCTASCTIGPGGTCGVSRPVLTGCAGGTPLVIAPGGIDFDTLTFTQITAPARAGVGASSIPLDPWVPIGSAIGVVLLAIVWRRRRVGR